jgi:two-component system, NtrC family, response regulator
MSTMDQSKPTLLIVEDDPGLQKQLKWSFGNYDVVTADDAESALSQVRRHNPHVVTMDLGLPPEPDSPRIGLELLSSLINLSPTIKVVVLTGQNERANALAAIDVGAYDFMAKPVEPDVLRLIVERAFRMHALQEENRSLRQRVHAEPLSGIISRDIGMSTLCRNVEKVAPTNATVMLIGESGTGKELFARGLHQLSNRRDGPFVAINCAAIPDTLLESELFGYERGAFTGAQKLTKGKVEFASGGTLFLDEIGDIPGPLQAKLLRFLQERVIERLGGRQEIAVDVRVICATHQNLDALITQGSFRQDLYYRLSEIVLKIPPLRSRPGDAVLIASAILKKIADGSSTGLALSSDAVVAIDGYAWPGNVRELENVIKRATILAEGSQIKSSDLGLSSAETSVVKTLRDARDEAEKQAVQHAIGVSEGNIARAADLLGISRPTLYDLMKRFGFRATSDVES